MMGLNTSDKTSASVERVIKVLGDFCPAHLRRDSLERFYAQYTACMAIRNGDAHLKNFGLLYSSFDDVRLSPVYDMLTMAAYAPRDQQGDALNAPALSFGGVRRWLTEKTLKALAARCFISQVQQQQVSEKISQAMLDVGTDMLAKAEQMASFRPTAARILELWSHGIKIHSDAASVRLLALANAISSPEAHRDRPIHAVRPSVE